MALPIILFVAALILILAPLPMPGFRQYRNFLGAALFFVGIVLGTVSSVDYNDAGFCSHIRTAFGNETSKCDLGWYFAGWGQSTQWPHFITIAHTDETGAAGSSISLPYSIRMADNWAGAITQTTRFGIPQDDVQFLKMARDFRSPERLITSTLRPAVTASLDTVANFFTMEEYYAGGQRDAFKTEFFDTVTKGRAVIERSEGLFSGPSLDRNVTPSDSSVSADTAETGGADRIRTITTKRLDASGQPIRVEHGYATYGIVVSTAILQNLDPDDLFEEQISERKEAAARRSIARERRLEEEEQRLLAIASAERAIAQRQGEAREKQITATTDADTSKRLALIVAEQQREQARIAKDTAGLALERAEIDAQARTVAADAEAYEKRALLEADNALQAKLATYEAVQRVWAEAFAQRRVPTTVFGGSQEGGLPGGDADVANFLKLKTVEAARDLNLDTSIGSNSN